MASSSGLILMERQLQDEELRQRAEDILGQIARAGAGSIMLAALSDPSGTAGGGITGILKKFGGIAAGAVARAALGDTLKGFFGIFAGLSMHIAWGTAGTVVGAALGGPLGAAIGGISGCLLGYVKSNDYRSLLQVLRQCSLSDVKELLSRAMTLVCTKGKDALTLSGACVRVAWEHVVRAAPFVLSSPWTPIIIAVLAACLLGYAMSAKLIF